MDAAWLTDGPGGSLIGCGSLRGSLIGSRRPARAWAEQQERGGGAKGAVTGARRNGALGRLARSCGARPAKDAD